MVDGLLLGVIILPVLEQIYSLIIQLFHFTGMHINYSSQYIVMGLDMGILKTAHLRS